MLREWFLTVNRHQHTFHTSAECSRDTMTEGYKPGYRYIRDYKQ